MPYRKPETGTWPCGVLSCVTDNRQEATARRPAGGPAAPVTVRLDSLPEEHSLPLLTDLLFFVVVDGVITFGFGVEAGGLSVVAVIASVVVFHFVQMRLLVTLRFDDQAITITRPWRRRRVPWSQIAGLIYTWDAKSSQARTNYRLQIGRAHV